MRNRMWLTVAMCVSVASLLVAGYVWLDAVRLSNRSLSDNLEWHESEFKGNVAETETLCNQIYLYGHTVPIVSRANAYAARQFLRSGRTNRRQSIVLWARVNSGSGGDGTLFFFPAVELGHHRTHLVAVLAILRDEDERTQIVRVEHNLSQWYDLNVAGGVLQEWDEVSVEDLIGRGSLLADGTIFVDNPRSKDYPERLLIPPGPVAIGLKYADGSYSNFVPLDRAGPRTSVEKKGEEQ